MEASSFERKLKDHWAITVNANWRMTFIFKDGNAIS
jgi:proteic killer suppression protein